VCCDLLTIRALLILIAALVFAAPAHAMPLEPIGPQSLYGDDDVAAAQHFARTRAGTVAFAVLDDRGEIQGLNRTQAFPSASVVKAMLLVAELRAAGSHPLSEPQRALLSPMIRVSDNDAAEAVFDVVGRDGLDRVAKAAGMRRFSVGGALFDAQLTPADQARFFLRIDRLVPAAHRAYARKLLSSIVPEQSWGIPASSRPRGFKTFFKGGWRTDLTHQVALLEHGSQRMALAVFTTGTSMAYGEATIKGIADRVLDGWERGHT
jgi:hypothetical protein